MTKIHPTAIVDTGARIHHDVRVGPHVVIEDDVDIDAGTVVMAGSFIARGTRIGKNNRIHMGAVIGHEPQDLAFHSDIHSYVHIGHSNEIREYVTIHKGTKEGSSTHIGNNCFLMGASHVAHNCQIGNHVILANGVLLAGYVDVGEHAFISGMVAVHQFVRIGAFVILSGHSAVNKDIPPFMLAGGRPCAVSAVNLVALRRGDFSPERIEDIKKDFKILFKSELNKSQAIEKLSKEPPNEHRNLLLDFLEKSERGLCIASGLKDRA